MRIVDSFKMHAMIVQYVCYVVNACRYDSFIQARLARETMADLKALALLRCGRFATKRFIELSDCLACIGCHVSQLLWKGLPAPFQHKLHCTAGMDDFGCNVDIVI